MKLLGRKAILDGIEARQSLNCSEHAWPERPVAVPGCVSSGLKRDLLVPTEDKVEHEGHNRRRGMITGCAAACNRCLFILAQR